MLPEELRATLRETLNNRFLDRDAADRVLLAVHEFEEAGGDTESYEELDCVKLRIRLAED